MKLLTQLALTGTLVMGLIGPAVAKTAAKPAAPTCPACKMKLASAKSAKNPKSVKINGKTYYCCDKCKMEAPKK